MNVYFSSLPTRGFVSLHDDFAQLAQPLDRFQAGLIELRLPFLRQAALSSLMGPTAHRRPPPCLTQKSCAIIRPIQPENGLGANSLANALRALSVIQMHSEIRRAMRHAQV
jgi:hypothetical protein